MTVSEPEAAFAERPLVVVDVGARWGAADVWSSLAPHVHVFGFDPDPEECARLNDLAVQREPRLETYVPVALGEATKDVTLYVTRQPACSSIYPPREELRAAAPALSSDLELAETQTIRLRSLDEWCADEGVTYVDGLKLDTQGSELGVLRGATTILPSVLWVEVEVEFNPIYQGQPLFGDVDAFLREHGFVLWRFGQLVHYPDGGRMDSARTGIELNFVAVNEHVAGGPGQLYWGMAYYVRADLAFTSGKSPDPDAARRLAALAGAAGFPDLALSLGAALPAAADPVEFAAADGASAPVSDQDDEVTRLREANAQLAGQVTRLRRRVRTLKRDADALRSSTTWRLGRVVTKPLGGLKRR